MDVISIIVLFIVRILFVGFIEMLYLFRVIVKTLIVVEIFVKEI